MSRGTIAALRDLVPLHPLNRWELISLAQLQAERFLELAGIDGPAVPDRLITDLPRVRVERFSPLPVSGATHWTKREWLVVLNSAEPPMRQRFSLFHEAKHIIDHRFADVMYRDFRPDERHALAEQMCNYFAGCLLVPRPWLEEAWQSGIQEIPQLAARFDVSQAAVQVRLRQIGLRRETSRGIPPMRPEWRAAIAAANKPAGRERRISPPRR